MGSKVIISLGGVLCVFFLKISSQVAAARELGDTFNDEQRDLLCNLLPVAPGCRNTKTDEEIVELDRAAINDAEALDIDKLLSGIPLKGGGFPRLDKGKLFGFPGKTIGEPNSISVSSENKDAEPQIDVEELTY